MDLTIENVKSFCDDYFDIDIATKSRKRFLIDARQYYYNFCREYIKRQSMERIGLLVYKRHSSVCLHIKRFNNLYNIDKKYTENYIAFEVSALKHFEISMDKSIVLDITEKDRLILSLRKRNSFFKIKHKEFKKEIKYLKHSLTKLKKKYSKIELN